MVKWIEEIPQWIEDYPDWVEGQAPPRWVECGWTDFSPQWIDGPVCPTIPDTKPIGIGWETINQSKLNKIRLDDDLCLQIIIKCFIMTQSKGYTHVNRH